MEQHLWDRESYRHVSQSGESHIVYKSWNDFAEPTKGLVSGNALYDFDDDLNFLYRWDWVKVKKEDYLLDDSDYGLTEEELATQKKAYAEDSETDTLYLYFMLPRKGKAVSVEVTVVEEEEPLVRAWLELKWYYMKRLWEPVS